MFVLCVTNGLHREDVLMLTNEVTLEKSRLCVLCVTNDMQEKEDWMFTKEVTVEKRIFVLSVTNVFHLIPVCLFI